MFLSLGAVFLCMGVCLPLFMYYKKSLRPRLAACFKVLGTCCALVVALVAALRLDSQCWVCVIALALQAAGDYALEFSFPLGMGFFMAGHIAYIAWFAQLFPVTVSFAVILGCLLFLTGIVMYRWRDKVGKQMPLFILYALILCGMTAFALSGGFSAFSVRGILIAAAATFFFLSDFMILLRLLFPAGRWLEWTVMVTYYCAQLLFGISCLYT